jgi:hypothetical protein
MSSSAGGLHRWRMAPLHVTLGALALTYAWLLSGTSLVTTAAQFVSPLAIVLLGHVAWLGLRGQLAVGFAPLVFRRAFVTSLLVVVVTALGAIVAPMPADAAVGEFLGAALGVIACVAMIAVVMAAATAIVGGIGYAIYWSARSLWTWWRGRNPSSRSGDTGLFDAGAVVLALAAIVAMSLEGIVPALTANRVDGAGSSVLVATPPARVWAEVGKATSPSFPLPALLHTIPRPVAVIIDEGASLGARRVVRFKGREGEGDLVLQVTRRTDIEAVFTAQSDGSPIAMWVRHKALTFRVEAEGLGTRLTVSSDYDGLLSPAWFFRPYVRLAVYFAVDVLARDTRQRAEARK